MAGKLSFSARKDSVVRRRSELTTPPPSSEGAKSLAGPTRALRPAPEPGPKTEPSVADAPRLEVAGTSAVLDPVPALVEDGRTVQTSLTLPDALWQELYELAGGPLNPLLPAAPRRNRGQPVVRTFSA